MNAGQIFAILLTRVGLALVCAFCKRSNKSLHKWSRVCSIGAVAASRSIICIRVVRHTGSIVRSAMF